MPPVAAAPRPPTEGPNIALGKTPSARPLRRNRRWGLEDVEDYNGFEAAIIADFNAEIAVERELVLRLASLLWRLRRATSIETEIFQIQAEILHERRLGQSLIYLKLGAAHISDVANIEEGHGDGHPASRAATRLISTMPGQPRLRRILPEIWLTASSDSSTWTVRPSNISGATSGRFRAKSRKRYFFFEGKKRRLRAGQ
jgi:hypothetical protein